VPAYAGLAAVDLFLGATELPEDDPANGSTRREFRYGGAHVIADLVAGKEVHLEGHRLRDRLLPRKEIDTWVRLADLNEAVLFNPRNVLPELQLRVNLSDRIIYTYRHGILKPKL